MPMSSLGAAGGSSRGSPTVGGTSANAAKSKGAMHAAASNSTAANHGPPLSSMKSAPLDLRSVERRGQPTATREPSKKTRPHDLQEAPTFCPTEDEWQDPMEYMNKIAPEASQYGICKIIPPESWNPDFAIDTEKFHFRTRKQELNSVEGSTRANLAYLDGLAKYHKQHGNNLHRLPYVDKKPLDLYRLKKAVDLRGGFEQVCKLKKWAEIGRDLGYSGKIMTSLSTSLKNSYSRWLCPYENYLKKAKPSVQQQLELEYGGPPSPSATPIKRSNNNTPASAREDSPVHNAADTPRGESSGLAKDEAEDTAMPDTPTPSKPSGFTAVNSGGFKAVNSGGGGFTAVNSGASSASKLADAKDTPQKHSGSSLAKSLPPNRTNSLKRQLSTDSLDSKARENGDKDDGDGGSRRSKRLKKDNVPTVAGSHMTFLKPNGSNGPKIPRDEKFVPGEKCETCAKGDEVDVLIQCESCDNAYHGACLDPPLKTTPDSEWNCHRCLVGDGQFGFEEGGLYSLRAFQQKAALFKQNYFEKKMPFDPVLNCPRPVTEEDVEAEFWRLVVDLEETVEVEYGADIHCTTHGSGFPTIEKHPNNPYSTDPWNLNILPLHGDSLFRHIKSDISGMTVPWVYVGMTFSTFCWHNEDHYSYSANYQHFGATKTWYGIPGADAEKFEQAMREAVPELFETQPDLLFQLVTLLPPEHLKKAGVRVYAIDQRAGQFVITFPQAYHAGFNHGFNFNEAVNFAPVNWEPFGLAGVDRMQEFRRQPCFSHDELLWTAAENPSGGGLSIQTAKWLAPALDRIHKREKDRRETFVSKHLEASAHRCKLTTRDDDDDNNNSNNDNDNDNDDDNENDDNNNGDNDDNDDDDNDDDDDDDDDNTSCPLEFKLDDVSLPEDEYQCAYCKAFSFLSRFKCVKSGKVLCLAHAGTHPCCDSPESERFLGAEHILHYRKSDAEIEATYGKVRDKAHMPEAWEERYEKLLDEAERPSLRSLRNMLHEGEKIPWELPSLPVLREFVDRCNEWVEEATPYTIRKQQNRRKSEKMAKKPNGVSEKKDREVVRDVSSMFRLLQAAEQIGFDCQEITQLTERLDGVKAFQTGAAAALRRKHTVAASEVEDLLEDGRSFNVDLPEVEDLASLLETLKWNDKAEQSRGIFMTMKDVEELVENGKNLKMQPFNDHLKHYSDLMVKGQQWEAKVREVMTAETIHYAQLEALSSQVQMHALPVSQETYAAIDQILHKHREAHKQIIDLMDRSRSDDYRRRPKYAEVTLIMKRLEDLNSKPHGTSDLEREQRRHEDWMRKGKKLFGKSNAPLHILKSHMEYVLERNSDCFDMVHDKPRMPAEPASREPSPDSEGGKASRWEDIRPREVFCICRKTEAGLMIECEVCHEWYHSKCLKIARGKIKDEDKYTCPVCDWRVKIPRDAARPKLEGLMDWYDEIPHLPFQPEEEDVLKRIIEEAQEFRHQISGYCTPGLSTKAESDAQRFYLRKMEGAEILLAWETNFFRQELHKWCPVAPEAPPVQDASKSTRKPRPTKLQRILTEHRVRDVDELPETVRAKAQALKRKQQNQEAAAAAAAASMNSGPGSSSGAATTSPMSFAGSYGHQVLAPRQSLPGMGGYQQERRLSTSPSDMSLKDEVTEVDPAMANSTQIHPSLLLHGHDGGPGEHAQPSHTHVRPHGISQMLVDSRPLTSLEQAFLRGQEDGTGLGLDSDEGGKEQGFDMLSRTETGRRRAAAEALGPEVWDPVLGRVVAGGGGGGGGGAIGSAAPPMGVKSIMGSSGGGGGGGAAMMEDEGEVDKMFTEMTNQDDEEKRGQ